jgi:chromosomal replication initiation ATPase DnaA
MTTLRSDILVQQLPLDLGHEPSLAEDDFLVGEGNELAYARVLAWPHWPDPVSLIIGPVASGKSHLGRIFADHSGAVVVTPDTIAEVAGHGGQGPLLIEDADRLAYAEHDLFHLLNQAMRGERTILLTARDDVGQWPIVTDDVRSRLRRAPVFRLEQSRDIELSHMFVKLFGDRQIRVDPKVIGYVVPRMERSAEEAAILVDIMDRLALAKGSAITRAIAAEALALRQAQSADRQQDWDAEQNE